MILPFQSKTPIRKPRFLRIKGLTITETNNANGTKNYAVSAKLGKGLKVDENGAIAATAQLINGGAGVTITTNVQDEAVVIVAGIITTTDDGKSYTSF